MNTTTTSASQAARLGAEAAGRAANAAIVAAAENAAKPGAQTSELKVTVGSIGLAALLACLKALSVIPGPWQIPAVLGVAAVGASAVYTSSRAKVKAAALAAVATGGAMLIATPNAER